MTGPKHAPIPASGAPQWGHCSGSIKANAAVPDTESRESREGEAVHWVGEMVLRRWNTPDAEMLPAGPMLDQIAPNGVVIDEAMVDSAQVWINDVLEALYLHESSGPHMFFVEERVAMPMVHPDNWGTLDTGLWLPGAALLYVWDFKNGHREVSAKENLQLIDYAVGLALAVGAPADTKIVLRIVQPNCYSSVGPVREWATTLAELAPYVDQLHRKAHESQVGPTFTAGKHCRDCAAVARCPTAKRMGYSVITYAGEPYQIDTLTGTDLAIERRILTDGLAVVKSRLEAVEDEITLRLGNGATDTGLALESKLGRLKWSVPVPQALALATQFGVDASKDAILTPTQTVAKAPARLRAGFKQVLESVTEQPTTGLRLIDASDTKTSRAFTKQ